MWCILGPTPATSAASYRKIKCLINTEFTGTLITAHASHFEVIRSMRNRLEVSWGDWYTLRWGTRWRSWLRHCATNRKVAGSIGIFHWHNPFGRTMALGSTQHLTEMSTRNISWGVKAAGAYRWQPTTFMCQLSRNLGASTSWNPQGLSRPVMGLLYLYIGWGRLNLWRINITWSILGLFEVGCDNWVGVWRELCLIWSDIEWLRQSEITWG
jgi:hypothetical protein